VIPHNHRTACIGFMLLSAIGLYLGWREFLFLTDDAYIAFRYVSNSILGYGYVWNAEPFRAVEGYSSFLWVVMLDAVWRVSGVEPPRSANLLSLVFSYFTIVATTVAILRMRLSKRLASIRIVFIGLVLLGLLVNTTFLTWSSSGMETALFNFCFLSWMLLLTTGRNESNSWWFGVTVSAVAVYLARPDGILVVSSTLLIMVLSFIRNVRNRQFNIRWCVAVSPIIVPGLHVLWRRFYYGEWLPNTYYAKHVAAWPESGVRYLLSYILEYGVWIWIVGLMAVLVVVWRRPILEKTGVLELSEASLQSSNRPSSSRIKTTVAVLTLCFQIGYYTFAVGGDHFEWRVYSHLPPLTLVSFVYFLNVVRIRPIGALIALVALISLSTPIPWTKHMSEKRVNHIRLSDTLQISVADRLPFIFWPLAKTDDILQEWLTDHLVCVRRQEHVLFLKHQLELYPKRTLVTPKLQDYPVAFFSTVGVPGWVFPKVSIIDGYGLNDYIIARHAPYQGEGRKMAHDRYPPESYVESFIPNMKVISPGRVKYQERPPQFRMTAERIIWLEKYWENKIVRKIDEVESTSSFILTPSSK